LVEGSPVTPEELKEKILSLRKQGLSKALIGQKLRDEEGVPSIKRILGRSLKQVLIEEGEKETVPEDLANLLNRKRKIQEHLEQHPKDNDSKKGLIRTGFKDKASHKVLQEGGSLTRKLAADLKKSIYSCYNLSYVGHKRSRY